MPDRHLLASRLDRIVLRCNLGQQAPLQRRHLLGQLLDARLGGLVNTRGARFKSTSLQRPSRLVGVVGIIGVLRS